MLARLLPIIVAVVSCAACRAIEKPSAPADLEARPIVARSPLENGAAFLSAAKATIRVRSDRADAIRRALGAEAIDAATWHLADGRTLHLALQDAAVPPGDEKASEPYVPQEGDDWILLDCDCTELVLGTDTGCSWAPNGRSEREQRGPYKVCAKGEHDHQCVLRWVRIARHAFYRDAACLDPDHHVDTFAWACESKLARPRVSQATDAKRANCDGGEVQLACEQGACGSSDAERGSKRNVSLCAPISQRPPCSMNAFSTQDPFQRMRHLTVRALISKRSRRSSMSACSSWTSLPARTRSHPAPDPIRNRSLWIRHFAPDSCTTISLGGVACGDHLGRAADPERPGAHAALAGVSLARGSGSRATSATIQRSRS